VGVCVRACVRLCACVYICVCVRTCFFVGVSKHVRRLPTKYSPFNFLCIYLLVDSIDIAKLFG
jgi:hypothetical protein